MILPVSFQGKRVLVTGAGRGLGKALVKALIKNDATVFALSRTKSTLDELKAEHPQVTTLCVDLQNWTEVRQAVKSLQGINMLVNNAALNIPGDMMKVTPEDFDKVFHTNVLPSLNITQIVATAMIERNEYGSIVNISSIAQNNPGIYKHGLYGISKATLGMMTRTLSRELGPHNIRVNTVNPGLFPSEMSKKALDNPKSKLVKSIVSNTPLGRIATVDEVVNVTLFLLSDYSSYVTGQSIFVCGGFN